jgi:hypothetical protein
MDNHVQVLAGKIGQRNQKSLELFGLEADPTRPQRQKDPGFGYVGKRWRETKAATLNPPTNTHGTTSANHPCKGPRSSSIRRYANVRRCSAEAGDYSPATHNTDWNFLSVQWISVTNDSLWRFNTFFALVCLELEFQRLTKAYGQIRP